MAKLNKLFHGSAVGARVRLETTKIEIGEKNLGWFSYVYSLIFSND
jgi:hypothetical protein